jgi:hypothetical protein
MNHEKVKIYQTIKSFQGIMEFTFRLNEYWNKFKKCLDDVRVGEIVKWRRWRISLEIMN